MTCYGVCLVMQQPELVLTRSGITCPLISYEYAVDHEKNAVCVCG